MNPDNKFPELRGLTPEQQKAALRHANRKSFLHPLTILTLIILAATILAAQTLLSGTLSPVLSGAIAGAIGGLIFSIIRIPLLRKLIIEWRRKNGL